MSLPWFRMYSEFAGDPVIQSLAFEDQRHYIILLCLKCNGTLDREIADSQRERIIIRGLGLDHVTAGEAKRRLSEVGLIDEAWQPIGWDKRQFVSDISTGRVRKYRNNNESGNVSETFHVTVPETDQNRTDKDTEQNRTDTTRQISDEISTTGLQAEQKNNVPYERIVALYHEKLPELPRCVKLTNQRKGYIRQRWLEDMPDLDSWDKYFGIVRQSKFLMGQARGSDNRPPFRADLPWLCRPENVVKVIEGKYHRG